MKSRANETIWRLARFLHTKVADYHMAWDICPQGSKDWYYDRALELYRKTGMTSTIGLK